MKKKPLSIKAIQIIFDFDKDFIKTNLYAPNVFLTLFDELRKEKKETDNYLYKYGTWTFGKEIVINGYNCSPTRVIIHNFYKEEGVIVDKEKAKLSNKLIKKDADGFIKDFALATVELIERIKNCSVFEKSRFWVRFRISYSGTGSRILSSEYRLVYDTENGWRE